MADRKVAPLRSPFDQPITFTHFPNLAADNKRERTIRFRDLPDLIGQTQATKKLLTDAGIAAVLHTTASHTPSAPRWHVFCPLSDELRRKNTSALRRG
jgi:hypothetical protein